MNESEIRRFMWDDDDIRILSPKSCEKGSALTWAQVSALGDEWAEKMLSRREDGMKAHCTVQGCGSFATQLVRVKGAALPYCDEHLPGAKDVLARHRIKVEDVRSAEQVWIKALQFFTNAEGKVVPVGGPSSGGGSSSSSSGISEVVSKLQARLGTSAKVSVVDNLTTLDLMGNERQTDAYYDPAKKSIVLDSKLLGKNDPGAIGDKHYSTADAGYEMVVAHELMHEYDGMRPEAVSESAELVNLFFSEKDKAIDGDRSSMVSKYSMSQPKEFFAENGAVYLCNPSWLKANSRDVFDFFDALLGAK